MQYSEIYHVNSNLRLNPATETHQRFSYELSLPDEYDFDRVCMLKASIPKSYYNVNSNFSFTLDENGSTAQITLTPANYTRRAFATVLQSRLNTLTPTSWVYTVSYDNSISTGDRGLWTFTVSGNGGVQPSFIFTAGNPALEILGFSQYSGGVEDLTKEFTADTLLSENVPLLQSEQTIFIRSDICQNAQGNNILGTVFSNGQDFGSAVFVCPDVTAFSRSFSRLTSGIYKFWITDENGTEIDLNGINVNLQIILYKKDSTNQILSSLFALKSAKEYLRSIN